MSGSSRLTAAFLLALAGAAGVARPPGREWLVAAFAAIAGATFLLARLGGRSPRWALARDLFPVAAVLGTYALLEPLIVALVPWRLDRALAAFDDRWLPTVVEAWHGFLGRPALLTDAAYAAYFSFYALPLGAALRARAVGGTAAYERALTPILVTFYACFVGYLVLPALGPRLAPATERALLGGGALSDAVRAFLAAAEATRLDAFPSGHTAVSLVSAAVAPARSTAGRAAWWGWALVIVFSTVYVHVHYVVDVIAGAALAVLVVALWRREPVSASGAASPPPPR